MNPTFSPPIWLRSGSLMALSSHEPSYVIAAWPVRNMFDEVSPSRVEKPSPK